MPSLEKCSFLTVACFTCIPYLVLKEVQILAVDILTEQQSNKMIEQQSDWLTEQQKYSFPRASENLFSNEDLIL